MLIFRFNPLIISKAYRIYKDLRLRECGGLKSRKIFVNWEMFFYFVLEILTDEEELIFAEYYLFRYRSLKSLLQRKFFLDKGISADGISKDYIVVDKSISLYEEIRCNSRFLIPVYFDDLEDLVLKGQFKAFNSVFNICFILFLAISHYIWKGKNISDDCFPALRKGNVFSLTLGCLLDLAALYKLDKKFTPKDKIDFQVTFLRSIMFMTKKSELDGDKVKTTFENSILFSILQSFGLNVFRISILSDVSIDHYLGAALLGRSTVLELEIYDPTFKRIFVAYPVKLHYDICSSLRNSKLYSDFCLSRLFFDKVVAGCIGLFLLIAKKKYTFINNSSQFYYFDLDILFMSKLFGFLRLNNRIEKGGFLRALSYAAEFFLSENILDISCNGYNFPLSSDVIKLMVEKLNINSFFTIKVTVSSFSDRANYLSKRHN